MYLNIDGLLYAHRFEFFVYGSLASQLRHLGSWRSFESVGGGNMSVHFGGFVLDSTTDCYGFRKSSTFDENSYREFLNSYVPVLARRLKRWEKLFFHSNNNNIAIGSATKEISTTDLLKKRFGKGKLNRFVRKGIPTSLRPRVWLAVTGAEKLMASNPGAFEAYSCTKLDVDVAGAIELDLDRTFPDNEHFHKSGGNGRFALKQVLRALAAKRPDIGYCQGFNFIAGMLILIMNTPERAFWQMDSVLERFPSDFYGPNLIGVRVEIQVLKRLVAERAPDIDAIFRRFDVDLALLTTKWFICWFLENLPIETVLRLWDCLFSDIGGRGVDVLTRAACSLILHHRDRLLACRNFQHVADIFQTTMLTDRYALDCHKFVEDTLETTKWLTPARLKELRTQIISSNEY